MDAHVKEVVREMSKASDEERITFPEVVKALTAVGVERYLADLVAARKTYYLPNGDFEETPVHKTGVAAHKFSAEGVEKAVRAIQEEKIAYREFCGQIADAGCVGYFVSLAGRRAVLLRPHRGRACRMVSRRQAMKSKAERSGTGFGDQRLRAVHRRELNRRQSLRPVGPRRCDDRGAVSERAEAPARDERARAGVVPALRNETASAPGALKVTLRSAAGGSAARALSSRSAASASIAPPPRR